MAAVLDGWLILRFSPGCPQGALTMDQVGRCLDPTFKIGVVSLGSSPVAVSLLAVAVLMLLRVPRAPLIVLLGDLSLIAGSPVVQAPAQRSLFLVSLFVAALAASHLILNVLRASLALKLASQRCSSSPRRFDPEGSWLRRDPSTQHNPAHSRFRISIATWRD